MKKVFFYTLLLAALPLIGFTSCSDDDDLPDVDFTVEISDAVKIDGTIYVVQGETLTINSIEVKNNESNKSAIITAATYFWDGYRLGTVAVPPFGFEFVTDESTPLGRHEIAIDCPVYAVDKSPAVASLFYPVEVVADASDIPSGPGETTFVANKRMKAY